MTKRLILTRHAKSSWDDPGVADHDRALNERGRGAASDLGGWLGSRGYVPDQVLCSDAVRTRETWDRIAAAMPSTLGAELKPALYNAGPDTLLAVLRHGTGDTVMILAHNPGIAEFAHRVVAKSPASEGFRHYPTGATLVAEFAVDTWAEVAMGSGMTLDFMVPREIDA